MEDFLPNTPEQTVSAIVTILIALISFIKQRRNAKRKSNPRNQRKD